MPLPPMRPVRISQENEVQNLDAVAVIVGENDLRNRAIVSESLARLDQSLGGVVEQLVSLGDFEGKWLQTSHSVLPGNGIARRVYLVGSGSARDELPNRARQLGLTLAELAQAGKAMRFGVLGTPDYLGVARLREQLALGFHMGHYVFPKLNEPDSVRAERERPVELVFRGPCGDADPDWKKVDVLGRATGLCRFLQDSPPNVATPQFVSAETVDRARAHGLAARVMGASELREMGMNALLAVGSASRNEPQLVVIEYTPEKYTRTLALVGKGITFDTGGYSLKPADKMRGMKYDMSGAAVALSSVLAIAELKLPIRVFAVAALAENMIDSNGYRVDDIVTTYSGKTIEIANTDAEGRVVLSDALSYAARELKPDRIVEFSTLTGGIVVALGHYGAGVFPFNDDTLAGKIQCAAAGTGERVWPMPTWEEVFDDIRGTVADVNNVGATSMCASAACGAMFLREFVDGLPFAHIDIAGVAADNRIKGYPRKTGSGFGVQLAVEIARAFSEE